MRFFRRKSSVAFRESDPAQRAMTVRVSCPHCAHTTNGDIERAVHQALQNITKRNGYVSGVAVRR